MIDNYNKKINVYLQMTKILWLQVYQELVNTYPKGHNSNTEVYEPC
jgi:hypothetical protein